MRPTALGYVGVSSNGLDEWNNYAVNLLGLERVDRSARTTVFRMDDRRQRIFVDDDGATTINTWGWEVADAAALEAMARQIEAAGCRVERGSRALAGERCVRDLIVTTDPSGYRIEIFHGAETASEPFRPGRNISGFRTGGLGLGHTVLMSSDIDACIPFYRDVMGFGVSDFYDKPFKACFFHVNPRHHSFALIQGERNQIHHLMLELYSMDDVGQGYDLAQMEEGRIAVTMGRHAGDYVLSFYTFSPSKFMVEYGWGGQVIDPATWQPSERRVGPSIWGHDRLWMPKEKRVEARELALRNAREGLRQPVQVLEGNYNLMPGACPWWDANVRGKAAE